MTSFHRLPGRGSMTRMNWIRFFNELHSYVWIFNKEGSVSLKLGPKRMHQFNDWLSFSTLALHQTESCLNIRFSGNSLRIHALVKSYHEVPTWPVFIHFSFTREHKIFLHARSCPSNFYAHTSQHHFQSLSLIICYNLRSGWDSNWRETILLNQSR